MGVEVELDCRVGIGGQRRVTQLGGFGFSRDPSAFRLEKIFGGGVALTAGIEC